MCDKQLLLSKENYVKSHMEYILAVLSSEVQRLNVNKRTLWFELDDEETIVVFHTHFAFTDSSNIEHRLLKMQSASLQTMRCGLKVGVVWKPQEFGNFPGTGQERVVCLEEFVGLVCESFGVQTSQGK